MTESLMVTYMTCHLLGMSCTCTNPALYGYVNNNLNREISGTIRNIHETITTYTTKVTKE